MTSKPETVLAYAVRLFEGLMERAEIGVAPVPIFTGSITRVYHELRLPASAYSHVRHLLVTARMDHEDACVEFIQKGNRRTPSVIALYHAPSIETAPEDFTIENLTTETEVASLTSRVEHLEAWRESLLGLNLQALRNIEGRLTLLESERNAKKA